MLRDIMTVKAVHPSSRIEPPIDIRGEELRGGAGQEAAILIEVMTTVIG